MTQTTSEPNYATRFLHAAAADVLRNAQAGVDLSLTAVAAVTGPCLRRTVLAPWCWLTATDSDAYRAAAHAHAVMSGRPPNAA